MLRQLSDLTTTYGGINGLPLWIPREQGACAFQADPDSASLPDAKQQDIFWTIRQFVKRRDSLSKRFTILQNQLHRQLMYSYPSYRKFFSEIDGKIALYFWENYPSLQWLQQETAETFAEKLRKASPNACSIRKAEQILS